MIHKNSKLCYLQFHLCKMKKQIQTKFSSDKILVTSTDFGHFCPINNFVYFVISEYDLISVLRNSDCIFSRKKLKKGLIDS